MENELKFVLLEHRRAGEETHLDLMFETSADSKLATWRIEIDARQVCPDNSQPNSASRYHLGSCLRTKQIFDHERRFLDYEGPVNKGLGTVRRLDRGTVEILSSGQAAIRLRFGGKMLDGLWEFDCIEDSRWIARKL